MNQVMLLLQKGLTTTLFIKELFTTYILGLAMSNRLTEYSIKRPSIGYQNW